MRKPRAVQMPLLGEASAETTRKLFALHRSKRNTKAKPAPRPWQCIVLSTDQASKLTGWALFDCGNYLHSGELETHDETALRAVMRAALSRAKERGLPCVIVLEGHSLRPFNKRSFAVPSYLIEARRIVARAWKLEAAGSGHMGKLCAAPLSTWRAAILGPDAVHMSRDEVRPREQAMARTIARKEHVGGDEAPAICIGMYGSRSPRVGALLGLRARAASLAKWLEAR